MNKKETIQLNALVRMLKNASDAYYNKGTQTLSDAEFDGYVEDLRKLDPDNQFLKDVGSPPNTPLSKVLHTIPMGSLNNVNNQTEFTKWVRNLSCKDSFVAQPKIDGASIELLYRKGEFVQAITRGDGFFGDDITHTISKAKGFPKSIVWKNNISVRCEAVILLRDWRKYFLDEEASNPRNAVAGLIRRLDTENAEFITCIAFNAISNSVVYDWSCETEMLDWLLKMGFTTVKSYPCKTQTEVEQVFLNMDLERDSLAYEIDGVVVKMNTIEIQEAVGERDNRPKWAVAWKFAPKGNTTEVLNVEFSIGPTGTITPVAVVKPVVVGGTTITNVSLCNFDEVARLDIAIFDKVLVVRSGDVIPKITTVVSRPRSRLPIILESCPSCGSDVVTEGAVTHCSNPEECWDTQFRRVLNWIGKRNIMYLGEANLNILYEYLKDEYSTKILPNITDLYKSGLMDFRNAGIGDVMSKKILNEIDKSKKTSLADFIGSLALPLLGRREAQNMIDAGIDTVGKFVHLSETDLLRLEGYQKTKARRIVQGIQENKFLIQELSRYLIIIEEKEDVVMTDGILNGQSVCFTGAAEKPRRVLQDAVTKNGGIVKEDVSKGLDILVLADINSTSNKAVKARQYGTKLMSETEFCKLVRI